MRSIAIKELTLLKEHDCHLLQTRTYSPLQIAPHFHSEFEISLIENGQGAIKTIGAHESVLGERELLLIGPGLHHSWKNGHCCAASVKETTVHFNAELFGNGLLHRRELQALNRLLGMAAKGIRFHTDTIPAAMEYLNVLRNSEGFSSVLVLLRLLDLLASNPGEEISFNSPVIDGGDHRMDLVIRYMNNHFREPLTLKQAACMAGLSEIYFCRSFKQYTGRTFIEFLNEIRIQYVSRMLMETTHGITEIALEAGFKNLSNFNRIFRSRRQLSPRQYREVYSVDGRLRLCS